MSLPTVGMEMFAVVVLKPIAPIDGITAPIKTPFPDVVMTSAEGHEE